MFIVARSLSGKYFPTSGIELIVPPSHDGQTLPTFWPKNDADQKQWLHRPNRTWFEIAPDFVIRFCSDIMVVVEVVVMLLIHLA